MKKILALSLVLCLLTACGVSAPIEGRWQAADMNGTTAVWEFKDGTATVLAGETPVISGPYTYADGTLTVTIAEWAEPATYECKVTAKKMTLIQETVDPETQKPVKDKLVFSRVEE